jgi:hypothetical protein
VKVFYLYFLAAALFCAPDFLAAQGSFSTEIDAVRSSLEKLHTGAKEKHDNYARLGRLLQLSGDVSGAAEAWMSAAYAEGGTCDYAALLESAACYIAAGEWEKADANIKIVLLTARGAEQLVIRARYLAAQIEAFRNGNSVILHALAGDPDYKAAEPAIYLTLWKLEGKDEYMAKLLTEFPESPEARAVLAEKTGLAQSGKNYVTDVSSAQFYLYLGRENVLLDFEAGGAAPKAANTVNVLNAPNGIIESGTSPALQTGLFNSKKNALVQVEALKKSGFEADVVQRNSTGIEAGSGDYWSVIVHAGADINKTIMGLKNAGYEAFPVY